MSVDSFLAQLSKVRKTGNGQWTAACPCHQDRSPSLSIRETDDGRVLIHDFGGCSVEDVLGAVGMTFDDLFPPKPIGDHRPISRPFPATDVLRMIAAESLIVSASAVTLRTRPLVKREGDRLIEASAKIQAALTACGIDLKGVFA